MISLESFKYIANFDQQDLILFLLSEHIFKFKSSKNLDLDPDSMNMDPKQWFIVNISKE
jgi:hypothetical protein